MAITFMTRVKFTNAFRDLIKAQRYEHYVHVIISKSKIIFAGKKFNHVQMQANGEPDFIDQDGIKYEAKLIFDKKQGQLLGEHKNELAKWFESMSDETSEFSEAIQRRDLDFVKKTKLYTILEDRLNSVKEDENAILFIPYPIVNDSQGSVFLQFTTDFVQAV